MKFLIQWTDFEQNSLQFIIPNTPLHFYCHTFHDKFYSYLSCLLFSSSFIWEKWVFKLSRNWLPQKTSLLLKKKSHFYRELICFFMDYYFHNLFSFVHIVLYLIILLFHSMVSFSIHAERRDHLLINFIMYQWYI